MDEIRNLEEESEKELEEMKQKHNEQKLGNFNSVYNLFIFLTKITQTTVI